MSGVLVQLTLDDALQRVAMTCPRCGHEFDVRLARLGTTTRAVWERADRRFRQGLARYGPSEIAAQVGITPQLAAYHLRKLHRAGLVRAIPQNPFRQVRHLYTGNP